MRAPRVTPVQARMKADPTFKRQQLDALKEKIGRIEVKPAKRRSIGKGRKRRIHEASDGLCICGAPLPVTGPGVTYDHESQLWLGAVEDTDEAVRALCDDCNKPKTAKDASTRAKVKRLKAKDSGQKTRKGRPLPSRPFQKLTGAAVKIGSRPFDKRLSKGLDGRVRARKARRAPA